MASFPRDGSAEHEVVAKRMVGIRIFVAILSYEGYLMRDC
jgi:hypothetical protein